MEARDIIKFPDALISKETLICVGYDLTKADELWNRWSNWPADRARREIDDNDDDGLQVTCKNFNHLAYWCRKFCRHLL